MVFCVNELMHNNTNLGRLDILFRLIIAFILSPVILESGEEKSYGAQSQEGIFTKFIEGNNFIKTFAN